MALLPAWRNVSAALSATDVGIQFNLWDRHREEGDQTCKTRRFHHKPEASHSRRGICVTTPERAFQEKSQNNHSDFRDTNLARNLVMVLSQKQSLNLHSQACGLLASSMLILPAKQPRMSLAGAAQWHQLLV